MRITPMEVQQQRFKSRLFGYDTAEVDHFLELLAEELERLYKQNNELKENLAKTGDALEQMRGRERSLQETLVTAQQMTEEMKNNARREGDIVLAEAHIEAERIIRNANEQRLNLLSEIQDIKRQKVSFEVGLRALIENHLHLLNMDMLPIEEQEQRQLLQTRFSSEEIDGSIDGSLDP